MILFSTSSSRKLAQDINVPQGLATIKQFSDGELFVRIDQEVKNKNVWILTSTQAPAENILELFFLCDALERSGAHINIFFTYFAYARQVVCAVQEACSAEIISNILKKFIISQIIILHPHSLLLHNLLPFKAAFDIDFFCTQAEQYDAIAAPDKGAFELARQIAELCRKELILLTKERPDHEQVIIKAVEGTIKNKKILLVDDIISTGRTIIQSAQALMQLGATSVSAAATHGVFSPGSIELLQNSPIDKIVVTNSIYQQSCGKIIVANISNFIAQQLK